MIGKIVGRVERRHERERAFSRIPLSFVVDVVKNQAVKIKRPQPSGRCVGDLLHAFAIRRKTRWRDREQQKLTPTLLDTTD